MPAFCPKYGKTFVSEVRVVKHLNGRQSPCSGWLSELASMVAATDVADCAAGQTQDGPTLAGIGDDMDIDWAADWDKYPEVSSCPDTARTNPLLLAEDLFPGAGKTYGQAPTFMDTFDADIHAEKRVDNIFYPFANKDDWEMASFLLRSGLSVAKTDEFLSLNYVKTRPFLFRTMKDLRAKIELLPEAPRWTSEPISQPGYPTKQPMTLFRRNSVLCLEALFSNPLFSNSIDYVPRHVYQSAERLVRVFSEYMTGDRAWDVQSTLPEGATLLGVILSSDKTTLTAGTGNRSAHPLLLSLANLFAGTRMKASNHAFLLLALLPIPKFLCAKNLRGTLESRVVHQCLSIVTEDLKIAARYGRMMTDPRGYSRFCFTPLAAYIIDNPEGQLLAAVGGKSSPVTIASSKQLGDPFRHLSRTASVTLAQIQDLNSRVNPQDLEAYVPAAKAAKLNGVDSPFWSDWARSDPSLFLTPEPLHQWHKQFLDHDVHWCRNTIGDSELDFRFSIIQPQVGFRHFENGVSTLKQVTGREQRDIQRYFVACIAGAVPPSFLVAIRALMDFRYLAQAPQIDEVIIRRISDALAEFHHHKHAIVDAGARRGKRKAIMHWNIPKLELMQSVVPSIRAMGAPMQWTADVTERAHIEVVKEPFRASNHRDFDSQICRAMDRAERRRHFDLATSIKSAGIDLAAVFSSSHVSEDSGHDSDDDKLDDDENLWKSVINPVENLTGPRRHCTDLFAKAAIILMWKSRIDTTSGSPRTFMTPSTAFHLNRTPCLSAVSVDDLASSFQLPDLRPALADYVLRLQAGQQVHAIGGRRISQPNCLLPFSHVDVWTHAYVQVKPLRGHEMSNPYNIQASPRSADWPFGRRDTALIANTSDAIWPPLSTMEGHSIVSICLIFCLIFSTGQSQPHPHPYLMYGHRFDIVPQTSFAASGTSHLSPEASSGMYIVKRAVRADSSLLGDVIPLSQIRTPVQLIPRYGAKADPRLTAQNSFHFTREFFVNKYANREIYNLLT
ncbi:hypothetical protein HETIRDRAFT_325629 [Heterobasidion irregulare TC 32-1]|uniref:DUF6830 domain-containing protein n=1 Tax=Heterobasidion irregulare (strain TC 32-1) TaxID=747525 RepID=W4JZW1_HETIT|nr:uncharacterized protein HETIRDRAFT_325629 [Heterobasidion irregulare TC 32-1]ETW78381.1 hypothetical protein HETIRDRAFT_325629 [Heterobasidion irregulare TC 32-1]